MRPILRHDRFVYNLLLGTPYRRNATLPFSRTQRCTTTATSRGHHPRAHRRRRYRRRPDHRRRLAAIADQVASSDDRRLSRSARLRCATCRRPAAPMRRSARSARARVAVFKGRTHYHERGDVQCMRVPLETLKLLGATTVVLTGAAGSLKKELVSRRLRRRARSHQPDRHQSADRRRCRQRCRRPHQRLRPASARTLCSSPRRKPAARPRRER